MYVGGFYAFVSTKTLESKAVSGSDGLSAKRKLCHWIGLRGEPASKASRLARRVRLPPHGYLCSSSVAPLLE